MLSRLTKAQRLLILISITGSFFLAEISVGFKSRSLALVADAFHYLNDLVGFIVAFIAFKKSERSDHPKSFTYGWQRAPILGAFFNGVFLVAIGLSIFLQAIERLITLEHVKEPQLMLIMGCVGFALNIIAAACLHEHKEPAVDKTSDEESGSLTPASERIDRHRGHRHTMIAPVSEGHDLGMMGVLLHVLGDALNNVGVIIAGLVIWLARYEGRYYADPAAGVGIALLILVSAIPLVKRSSAVLLESVPPGIDLDDVRGDLEMIPGVSSIHDLHIWRLTQKKVIASAHVVMTEHYYNDYASRAQLMRECLHAYGIHSATLQPELVLESSSQSHSNSNGSNSNSSSNDSGKTEQEKTEQDSLSRDASSRTLLCHATCGQACQAHMCCQ